MDSVIAQISQHGYGVLLAVVFMEAVGLPFPAALALLVAGGASARQLLEPTLALGGALAVMLMADTLMFLLGRYTGWWLLGMLCRLSLNPESCILRSADAFYKRGRVLLLFAKFVPGINTLAPPLAGSMNMGLFSFLRLDVAGAMIYTGCYFAAGYLLSDVLGSVISGYEAFGRALGLILGALVAGYLGMLLWNWRKSRALERVPTVEPPDAARLLATRDAVVYDVRSHGYYDAKATRIQGSKRLDPNALHQVQADVPAEAMVYLYCTCIREATSARVARELMGHGVRVAVIRGGLRGWRKSGLPVEAVPREEMALLPSFV